MNNLFKKCLKLFFLLLPAIFFIAFFLITIQVERIRFRVLYDSDINWLLRTGELIVNSGFLLPPYDLYSYTYAEKPWILYQWLFEVITYLGFKVAQYHGVAILCLLVFTLTYTLLFLNLRLQKINLIYCLMAVILGGWTASSTLYARPANFTYLFTALLLIIFVLSEQYSRKVLWFVPVIFLFWANMHLGFTFGMIILLIFWVYKCLDSLINKADRQKLYLTTLSIATGISLLMTLVNPYGIKLYTYMITLMGSGYMNDNIKELLSPNFHKDLYLPVLIFIVSIILLSYFNRKQNLFYLIFLATSIYMTLMFVRNVQFFAIFATLVLALQLQDLQDYILNREKLSKIIKYPFEKIKKIQDLEIKLLSEDFKYKKIPISLIAIVIFILLLVPLMQVKSLRDVYDFSLDYVSYRPVEAYRFVLEYDIPGRFYTHPTWGSYAILKLFPKYKVFIDTRFDMYGDEFFKKAHNIKLTRGKWLDDLAEYDVNWICVPNNAQIAVELRTKHKKRWFVAYKDEIATIFVKNTRENHKWFLKSGAKKYYLTKENKDS
ncbi:MAG: hypothetical protein AB1782_09300 [Cyanobacteriota bacterium]